MLFYGTVNLCECWCGNEAKDGNRFIYQHNLKVAKKVCWLKGKKMPEEIKDKIKKSTTGRSKSEEHCKHISEGRIGIDPWNKDIKWPEQSEKMKVIWENPEYRENQIEVKTGKSTAKKGWKMPEEQKIKISGSLRGKYVGENNHAWKGGVTPKHLAIRTSTEYKEWRKQIFERDNYTCHRCRTRGGKLNVHHIINFSNVMNDENKLWNTDNGLTFCRECHDKFHSIFGTKNNTPQQLFDFIYLQPHEIYRGIL